MHKEAGSLQECLHSGEVQHLASLSTVRTDIIKERVQSITQCHKFSRAALVFSRCPVIANRIALGPPLPVYCEAAFNWKPLFQPWHQSGAPRHAQLKEEECASEDV